MAKKKKIVCPVCATEHEAGVKQCFNCGTKFKKTKKDDKQKDENEKGSKGKK